MSSITIELPEVLSRQIKMKGMSQQQLQTIFIRMIQVYLREDLPREEDDGISSESHPKTLRDLRGSIPVSQPQDFDIVRQQVIQTQVRKRMSHGN